MIQLIAMDLDGTLLTPLPAHITQRTVRVLQKASEQNIRLVLASGRLPDDASQFAADAGVDMAVIALNGSCMMLHPFGPLQSIHYLEPSAGTMILRLLLGMNAFFAMFCDHNLYVHEPDPDHPYSDDTWGTHLTQNRCRIFRNDEQAWKLAENGISKFVIIDAACAGILQPLRKQLTTLAPSLTITSSWKDNIEINPPHVTKGTALKSLCEMLSIPLSSVMAIGDNSNDLSMMRIVGCPVAMGNATQDIVDASSFRTLSNTEDGVALAVAALALHEDVKGVEKIEISH